MKSKNIFNIGPSFLLYKVVSNKMEFWNITSNFHLWFQQDLENVFADSFGTKGFPKTQWKSTCKIDYPVKKHIMIVVLVITQSKFPSFLINLFSLPWHHERQFLQETHGKQNERKEKLLKSVT